MSHTKCQVKLSRGSGEKDFLKSFTISRHGDNHGHMT